MSDGALRQSKATGQFVTIYQFVWVGVVLLLALRNLFLRILDHRLATALSREVPDDVREKVDDESIAETVESISHVPTRMGRFDSWMYHPISSKPWATCVNPLRIFIVAFVLSINVGFTLAVTMTMQGEAESKSVNMIHDFGMRAGIMALANAPPVFALTGRNGIVTILTGIGSQHLRFAHKTFGFAMLTLMFLHFFGATFASLKWSGGDGLAALYSLEFAMWGIVALVGGSFIFVFSLPFIRRRQYEIFVATHIMGAIAILVGIQYRLFSFHRVSLSLHSPHLATDTPELCAWTYSAIGFWAFERIARLFQLFSIPLLLRRKFRTPYIVASAELVHGAILLRVPFAAGGWSAGQYAYLRFLDPRFLRFAPHLAFQAHPFSIANVPTSSLSHEPEMLFVLRVRGGMTKTLSDYLNSTGGQASILLAVEGPYGHVVRADRYQDVCLVAGGSGITHIMSILAGVIEKARAVKGARTKRVQLVWIVQHLEQADWIVHDLFQTVQRASRANVALTIKIFVTRGKISTLPSPMSSSDSLIDCEKLIQGGRSSSLTGSCLDLILLHYETGPRTSIIAGRAPTASLVREFVQSAGVTSLVVACGPIQITEDVRSEVAHLSSNHGVVFESASFDC
ncbi:hypothetical protein P7C70_g3757, partial [Phenoliferia sp. Uapishka_3]